MIESYERICRKLDRAIRNTETLSARHGITNRCAMWMGIAQRLVRRMRAHPQHTTCN